MNDLIKEQFEKNRKAEELKNESIERDFPKGKEIAPSVYQVGNMLYIGDKL